MTTTECIVCFGAVATGEPPPLSSEAAVAAAGDNASPLGNVTPEVSPEYVATPVQDIHTSDSAVAVLPSCGHYLHNQCLKQWIEVSNTCALCRQPFNVVNVKAYVSGESSTCTPSGFAPLNLHRAGDRYLRRAR